MSWPVPTPDQIASRAAAVYEARLPGIDARSRNRVATATTRVVGTTATSMHLHIAAQAAELMPTTAVETLDDKAAMWGLQREAPRYAAGKAIAAGAAGLPIPQGLLLSAGGTALAVVTAATALDVNGNGTVAVQALLPGAAGDIAATTVLELVSPLAGLNPQSFTVDADGISGGLEAESDDSLRGRLLQEVRKGDEDGGVYYRRLVTAVIGNDAIIAVIPRSVGPGAVTVAFAMRDASGNPRAATAAEVAAVDAAVQAGRSIGVRQVNTLAATLQPVAVQLHLNPDTDATRTAATAGLVAQFAADAAVGGIAYVSRLDAAIANASGEVSHERVAPAADVAAGPTSVLVFGGVAWV